MAFKGFDENNDILGEGYQWNHYRHPSGHLINLQKHPAVKKLHNILCRFINCKSFEIFTVYTKPRDHSDDANFRPTDSITTLFNVITRASLPVTALTVNFMGYEYGNHPDPRRLQVSDKAQFIALGQHLKELKLRYTVEFDMVHDWTFNILLHAPKLHTLHFKGQSEEEGPALIHCLALADPPRSQLQNLQLECIRASLEDLMILLMKCRQTLQILRLDIMRLDASLEDVRRIFQTLINTFPALEVVSLCELWSGLTRGDFIHFPVVSENPFVDESQGATFEYASNHSRGWSRNLYVAYSGPKIDVALDILARTVSCAPRRI